MGRRKVEGLKRIHLMMDPEAIRGLDWLAELDFDANRSQAIRHVIADAVETRVREGSKRRRRSRR